MRLNTIKPAAGAKHARKRLGRGIGSGTGKTSGKGHKGQTARSGGYHKVGFEGGQMPLHRRLPKRGFSSYSEGLTAEVRLSQLNRIEGGTVDLASLKQTGIIPRTALKAKVILAGKIERAVKLDGVLATKGARAAIEAAGGSVAEPAAAVGKVVTGKKAQKLVAAKATRQARAAEAIAAKAESAAKPKGAVAAKAKDAGAAKPKDAGAAKTKEAGAAKPKEAGAAKTKAAGDAKPKAAGGAGSKKG